jgi:hypothetical protein
LCRLELKIKLYPGPAVEDLLHQSAVARETLWRSLGRLEPFALSQTSAAAASTSGARWPAERQNFRVIYRTNGNVILCSDGLSDPFDDLLHTESNSNGFQLEFFIESPRAEVGTTLADTKASWQFQLLFTVSQLAAGHGGIRSIIDDMGLLSTEAEGVGDFVPQPHRGTHVNRQGRVGALLGLDDMRKGSPDCERRTAFASKQ